MNGTPASIVCERVRGQISLSLDGELSQLEQRMLAAHVVRCAECRGFEAAVGKLTHELRAAPLEPLDRPVVVRRIGHAWMARAQAGVAAAVAIVAVGAVAQVASGPGEAAQAGPTRFNTTAQLTREVEQIAVDGDAFSRQGRALPL